MTSKAEREAARQEYKDHVGKVWVARNEDYSVHAMSVDKEALAPFSNLPIIGLGYKVSISNAGRQHPKHPRVFLEVRPNTIYHLPGQEPAKTTTEAGKQEYLYSHNDGGDQGDPHISAWRVVKTTPQFIFVKSASCGTWTPEGGVVVRNARFADRHKNWRIPRANFERDGKWFTGSLYFGSLYKDPQALWNQHMVRKLPPCAEVLGLQPGFTVEQVRAAYRTLTKQAHPDAGGSAAAFLELQKHYDQALKLAQGGGK